LPVKFGIAFVVGVVIVVECGGECGGGSNEEEGYELAGESESASFEPGEYPRGIRCGLDGELIW
jgi:hypothetical protein